MGWFRRLGLQRRIMLYVAIGLALMFTVGAYVGLLGINEATDLVYQERLGTAFTTAAILERDVQDLVHDVEQVRNQLLKADSHQHLEDIGGDLFGLTSSPTAFSFVYAHALWLIDGQGAMQLAVPRPSEAADALLSISPPAALLQPTLFEPSASSGTPLFGTLAVPVKDSSGVVRWMVVLQLSALNRDEPFSLPQARVGNGSAAVVKAPTAYGLEVMGPDGRVALTRRGGTAPGRISPHWYILQQHAQGFGHPFVYLHKPQKGQRFPPHVIAVAPTDFGPFTVVLEQREDEALALPLRLRKRLLLFSSIGFVAAMAMAWVTTRHVVKPTERLTKAAQHIAEGKVESPINVAAQDEIGILAESLETMRLRLHAWGSELEKQVQERTGELEERNRELRALYETLRGKEEQLRNLLGKVLGAQEDERKRVSRELHDGIGQALSALTMGLERLEQVKSDQWAHLQDHVQSLKTLATDTLSDLRRMTIALRPAALDDFGLVPAIRRYAELYLVAAGVDARVQAEGLDARLEPTLETVIYRVVQEAINNVARHSKATQATILLQSKSDTVVVSIEDNGRGFDTASAFASQGVGLQGMRERASLAGGKLTIDSRPGRGTMVRLEIPLGEKVTPRHDA